MLTWPAAEHLSRIPRRSSQLQSSATMPDRLASGLSNAMRTSDFDQIVEGALRNIPARFRSRMDNVAIVVEDDPATSQLNASGTAFGSTLLGLYEGRPLTHRSV